MENWIFLFLGLILAYLLEFTRPWVKSYFEKSSLSIRERRLYNIIQRYQHIKRMREIPAYLNLHIFRTIGSALVLLVLQIANTGLDVLGRGQTFTNTVNGVIVVAIASFNVFILNSIVKDTNDAIKFHAFEERMITKVKKLNGDPEDLDKTV